MTARGSDDWLANSFCCAVLLFAMALAGCDGVKPVTGGTKGTLRCGGELLGETQVNVYRLEGTSLQLAGFGVTNLDGSFELVTNGAKGALRLTPGEYRFTLESAGAPFQFSHEYTQADSTPLKVSWSAGDVDLKLEIPAAIPVR